MKIISRIERLEDELLPLPAGDTLWLHIDAIGEEGEVVKTTVFEVPQPPRDRPGQRRRGLGARGDW